MDDDLLDEALFSRDEEGRLIRLDEAVAKQLDQTYSLCVDGTPLTVPRAQVAKDAQGNPLLKPDGSLKLRYTTILDAIRHATEFGRLVRESFQQILNPGVAALPATCLGIECQSGNEAKFLEQAVRLCQTSPKEGEAVLKTILAQNFLSSRAEDQIETLMRSGQLDEAMVVAVKNRILFQPTRLNVERVPVLCHQDHLTPIAVCRVCAVQISNPSRGRTERKLLPACQHWVQDGMVVYTMWASSTSGWETMPNEAKPADRHRQSVRNSVQLLSELLSAQHLDLQRDRETGRGERFRNELLDVWKTLSASWEQFPQDAQASSFASQDRQRAQQVQSRFTTHHGSQDPLAGPIPPLPSPPESPFHVDFTSCILCDRCSRSCSEVRHFNVIGRSGKGAGTHIAFDLEGRSMYQSSCHSCGECMKACPTGAISFMRTVLDVGSKKWQKEFPASRYEVVEPKALLEHPLFRRMSTAFLEWNRGAVRRRKVKAGDVVARQHEFGNVAFVIEQGVYLVCRKEVRVTSNRLPERLKGLQAEYDQQQKKYGGAVGLFEYERNMILGEMSPMTHDRRTATVVALNEGSVLEIDRNVLAEMLRVPDVREVVEDRYAERALFDFVADENVRASLFAGLTKEENSQLIDQIAKTAKLVLVDPGQIICREREPASDFFFIYQGYVKISTREGLLAYRGRLNYIGEVSLVLQDWPEALELFPDNPGARGLRSATCSALDTVQLFRFPLEPIRQFLNHPNHTVIRDKLRQRCVELLSPETAR